MTIFDFCYHKIYRRRWFDLTFDLKRGGFAILGMNYTLGLFSHDGKVRILNFNSKCAF